MSRAVVALVLLGVGAFAATAVSADPSEVTPSRASPASDDYVQGKKAVEAKDWPRAIELLSRAEVQDDRNPDLQNFLGYAYRNVGRLDEAFKHYEAALRLNPRHRGAHEYIGEAYLLVNNLPKAEEHLAALNDICVLACEEHEDLKKAIAAYRARAGR
ncbi:MAG TPA: tetratricopeptide repeat protein [Methylomirabilota bacterium]|nr:tetratricopeptide repeat protein [Methylomirabilota bacterium]